MKVKNDFLKFGSFIIKDGSQIRFWKDDVAKMTSHAIFQYNVLAIDDTHNTWTNMIVKINIPRLLGSSDDKEKIGAARQRIEETVKKFKSKRTKQRQFAITG